MIFPVGQEAMPKTSPVYQWSHLSSIHNVFSPFYQACHENITKDLKMRAEHKKNLKTTQLRNKVSTWIIPHLKGIVHHW